MNPRAITVGQLNNYIRQVFEAEELLHNVEVIGDIEGLKNAGKAVYFSLKDENACINCVCFYPEKMKGVQNGANVVVRGTVSYWHKAGKISFVVNSCETFGWGALFLKFQQLQEKLKAEGLFDAGAKKSLPARVKRLGVVTSTSGAVIHDIKCVAHRRNPGVDIVVFPAAVQGVGADLEISNAIQFLNDWKSPPDVIIVARGGGSKDDLDAFNSERVARAVFTSKIPIVSAVGHENDWTLIDFVADLRAATPSAAAELCVPEVLTQRELTLRAWSLLRSVAARKTDAMTAQTHMAWQNLKTRIVERLDRQSTRLGELLIKAESNNPLAILKRGYTHTDKKFGELKTGDEIKIMYYNGTVGAEVKWIKDSNK